MRIILAALAFIQLIIASLVGLVGLFADGGSIFERAVLALIHPAAALALIIALAARFPKRRLVVLALALAFVNVVADVVLALAIFTGAVRGDFWLPLAFAVIPAVAGTYLLRRNRRGSV